MLSLRSTSPSAAALDRADTPARAAARPDATVGDAAASAGAQAAPSPREAAAGLVGVLDGLSTVAAVGVTVGTIPAALCRMRDIAVASNSGTLSETERARLRNEYMDLSLQVTSAIGESGRAGQVPATGDAASSQDDARQGQHPDHGSGDGKPPAPTPAQAAAQAAPAVPAAASPAGASASPALPQRIEIARPAALAQFHRQQAAAPRVRLSVRA